MVLPFKCDNIVLLKELIKDPDRKSFSRIIYELVYLSFLYKELPVHYFSRYLFKKGTDNIKDFLPNKLLGKKIKTTLNDRRINQVLDNKLYFDLFFRQFDIRLPRILMYNHNRVFISGTSISEVKCIDDFKILLMSLFENNSSYDSVFIKKTNSGSSGKHAYKLLLKQLKEDSPLVGEIYSEVIRSEFLFQETIRQHPEMNKITPLTLNTIRFDTFIDRNGNIDIISGYLRMSTNDTNHVDNINAGGCGVGIILKTGVLKKYGYSSLKVMRLNVLTEHPITKTPFENFCVPFFDQAKDLVIRAAQYIPGLRLVGWDVGITETGPVLVEGNSDYEISGNDLADGGYLANPVFRKVLHEINYL